GTWVDITAPGTSILSTSPGNKGYIKLNGTSMACPNVASLLALMKSQAPNLSNQQLLNCLYSSADNIDAQNPNYIGLLGAGRINARKAIQCVKSGGGGTCSTPTSLAVNDLTAETTTLVWNSVSGANGYNVEIRTQGNSNWYSFENNPFSNNSLPIVGMTPSTTYEFRVQAVCGSTNSTFSNPFTFTTQSSDSGVPEYCLSYDEAYDDLVDGGDCGNGIVEGPWEVWTNEAYVVAQCIPGQAYIFSICDGYSSNNWEAELSAVEVLEGGDIGAVFGNAIGCELIFTIPSDYSSSVNIAIMVANHNDCGGETEEINNGVPTFGCYEGGGSNACLFANSIYDDLTEGANCSNGMVEVPWEVWTNEAYLVSGCTPGQKYIFSICNGYNPNNWEAELSAVEIVNGESLGAIFGNVVGCELTFTIPSSYNNPVDIILIVADHNDCGGETTEINNGIPSFGCQGSTANCTVPTGLNVTNVQGNEALLVWNAVTGASVYNVQARQKGTSDWTEGLGIDDMDARYTGLSPCTDYEFRIQAICGSGSQSEYSSIFSFKTEGCAPPLPCSYQYQPQQYHCRIGKGKLDRKRKCR
ncbi:MAG: fibronectin type III domain-containing protein, partial [Chitinophagales bacterium]